MNKLIKIFLLTMISFMASAIAQNKVMTILVDEEIKELTLMPCFQNWSRNLEENGYFISLHSISASEQNLKSYKSIIQYDSPDYLFLLGDLKLPKMKLIQKNKHNRSLNKIVETETLFPLYSDQPFPKLGEKGSKSYFSNSNISTGILNLVYHRSSKYSQTGILKRYCEYFSKVHKYKNCERSSSIKAASMIDKDFVQLKGDIKTLTTSSKRYSLYEEILEKNNLDMAFLAAHANSKKIYYGKGETTQSLTVTSLLKKKITTKFFNLYSCRVFEDNEKYSVGKAFIGQHSDTLGVLGSTKSGALAYPKIYFDLLKKGYTFGEALLRYVKYYATSYGGDDSHLDNNGYHSGLVFYGDPTLDLHSCKETL